MGELNYSCKTTSTLTVIQGPRTQWAGPVSNKRPSQAQLWFTCIYFESSLEFIIQDLQVRLCVRRKIRMLFKHSRVQGLKLLDFRSELPLHA